MQPFSERPPGRRGPVAPRLRRRPRPITGWRRAIPALLAAAAIGAGSALIVGGCTGWDPTDPFERQSPKVNHAIELLDGGKYESAEEVLQDYLGTGPCGDAGIGLPPTVRTRPNGSFDLGLTLFHLAERYGQRFGEEEHVDAGSEDPQLAAQRALEIDCAQIIVKAIAADPKVPIDLRARAYYLSGNLEFMRRNYEGAVEQYDKALQLIPGVFPEAGGDGIGRDAAWNRAIALRRIEEQKDAGSDAEPDAPDDAQSCDAGSPDSGPSDASRDAEDDSGGCDGGGDGGGDDGGDGGGGDDQSNDGGSQDGGDAGSEPDAGKPPPPKPKEDKAEPPPSKDIPMERILDRLEQAPTYQEQEAKKRAGTRQRYVMEDT